MNDLKFACRQLLKNPGFSAVVVVTLALGIGANTVVFSLIHGLLFRIGPFPEVDRLVRIYHVSRSEGREGHSVANFLDYHQQNGAFSQMAAFYWSRVNLAGDDQLPEQVPTLSVTAEFFSVLGIAPLMGRTLLPEDTEPGSDRVVVLSYGLWQRRFGGDTNILGRAIRADGRTLTVVGVMPAQFDLRRLWGPLEAWTPAAFGPDEKRDRGHRYLSVVARLRPGVSLRHAQADLGTIAERLASEHPRDNAGTTVRVLDLIQSASDPIAWSLSYFLFATTGLVLLIACVNVANLQLARATMRQREVVIRAALGAGRGRLVCQFLTESLLLATLGGGLGLLLALWGADFFGARLVIGYLAGVRIPVDWNVLAYSLGLSVLTGLLCGLAPARQASQPDLNRMLKEGGRTASTSRSHHRWRSLLVVTEVALALMLLSASGLFIRAMQRFLDLDPGFRTDHLLTLQLGITTAKYDNAARRIAFYRQALQGLAALPGVSGAGASTTLPLLGTGPRGPFSVEGQSPPAPGQLPVANWDAVTSQFFSVLGLTVKQGRALTDTDDDSAPLVVVVNETLARKHWPDQNPVGQRISRGDPSLNDWVEIVGVVSDLRYPASYERPETRPQIYESLWQRTRGGTAVMLRTVVKPESLAEPVRSVIAAIDPDLPVADVITFEDAVRREVANLQLAAQSLGAFAVLGLLLASLGIYGVISYSVAQRTNELGIRLALGARPADVLRLVVRQGMRLVLAGVAIGLFGAFLLSLAIRGLLYGISAFDPTTFGLVLAILIGAALLACYLPARRAARVDPTEALRCE